MSSPNRELITDLEAEQSSAAGPFDTEERAPGVAEGFTESEKLTAWQKTKELIGRAGEATGGFYEEHREVVDTLAAAALHKAVSTGAERAADHIERRSGRAVDPGKLAVRSLQIGAAAVRMLRASKKV